MAQMPDPWPALSARLRAIENRLNQHSAKSPFWGTGIHPNGEQGLDSDNFVTDVSGFRLAETPEFNDLKLRGGIIGNDALTQPVVPGVSRASATNFALTVAWAELAGQTLTIPSLATTLLATVSGRMYAINPRTSGGADGTGTDALFVSVQLGAQASQATPTGISGSNGFATTNCSESFIVTGLTPGSTIRLSVYGSSGYQSLAAQADNYASFAATLVWLR
jgi:hypothetical protein